MWTANPRQEAHGTSKLLGSLIKERVASEPFSPVPLTPDGTGGADTSFGRPHRQINDAAGPQHLHHDLMVDLRRAEAPEQIICAGDRLTILFLEHDSLKSAPALTPTRPPTTVCSMGGRVGVRAGADSS